MTSKKLPLIILLATLTLCAPQLSAQLTINGAPPVYDSRTKTYMVTLPESAFGGAFHADAVLDDDIASVVINGQAVTTDVDFPLVDGSTSYTFVFTKQNGSTTRSTLHFTYLPIMILTGSFSDDYITAPVKMIFPDGNGVQNYRARIKNAGASTNTQWVHKNNLHVKFVDDNGEKMDVSFFGLRNDNHWRLDAGTRDMIRFRNYAANGLWADLGAKTYYADKEPKARSYIRGSHVEAFLNNQYYGFYNLHEFLDRKQLKLKKYAVVDNEDDDSTHVEFHGLMWKAKTANTQTLFLDCAAALDNTKDNWGGFDIEYPDIDDVCPTNYDVLYNAIQFTAQSRDTAFINHADEYFDIPLIADYYMFINVVFGIDNACNNMVWSCYDCAEDKKITLSVWDLDATVGQHYTDIDGYYHADVIQPENELENVPSNMCGLSSNRLFKQLKKIPVYRRMAVNRYWQLRETVLDPDSLVARYTAIYNRLDNCGALAREAVRWSDTGDIAHRFLVFDEEFEYLCDWLRRRIAYLDTHTFARLLGDVDGDGLVNMKDVTTLIAHLLSPSTPIDEINSDVDTDNVITVGDLSTLISIILNQ